MQFLMDCVRIGAVSKRAGKSSRFKMGAVPHCEIKDLIVRFNPQNRYVCFDSPVYG